MNMGPILKVWATVAVAASMSLAFAGPAQAATPQSDGISASQMQQILATMTPAERANLGRTMTVPGVTPISYDRAAYRVNPPTGTATRVSADGTYGNSYIYMGVGVVRISNTSRNYSWVIQAYIETRSESAAISLINPSVMGFGGEDHLSLGWGGGLALINDSSYGLYYGGQRVWQSRQTVTPQAGVDYGFVTAYGRTFDYFTVSVQVKETTFHGQLVNAVAQWTHTYDSTDVGISIGVGATVGAQGVSVGPSFGIAWASSSHFYTRAAYCAFQV